MANIRNCSFFHSRILTRGRILFSILAVLAFGVVVNAQTVVRTNGGTETATGTDVSTVQKADGWASGDVISVSGTSATSIAPFSSSVRVESSSNYTVTDFTVQSATGDKQYIGALPNSRNYVLKLGNKNYNLTFKNVEFQNNDIAQNTAGIFLIMDQATSTVTLNLDNASFTKFQGSGDGNYGGIINSSGDLTINGTNTVSFYGNGTGSGGAIFAGKGVTINCDEMIFDNNACNNSGAIRNNNALSITGSKVTFTNNSARNNGGSIYSSSTITMTGKDNNSVLTFTGNSAKNEGGVIYSTGTGIDLDFDTINFSNNQATNFGGAIRFNNTNTNYKVTITGETVTFDNNSALNKNGGAIHTNASVALKGKSENSVFTISNNTAPNGNSGFIVAVGSVEISTGSFLFQNNTASGIAGAIEARKGITFSGDSTSATFTGNYAGENGSDLYLSNANSVLTFQDAGTYYFDGGIFLSDATQSVVIDKAQVTIAGRSNVSNNNYQLQTVNISNGGKLTANLDYIDSLSGTFNVGTAESEGTLEFSVGDGLSKTLPDTVGITFAEQGSFVKAGAGTLTLTQAPGYACSTTVESGTLALSEGGTLYNLTGGSINDDGSVAVAAAVDASGKELTIDNAVMTTFVGSIKAGSILKTGYGTLKIYADEENKVVADTFTVTDSELDFKGYFEGSIEVINDAFFSPGNSIGEANVTGNVSFITNDADSNGFAYFEFGDFTGADENHDLLVLSPSSLFNANDEAGVVLLDFANDDAEDWASSGVDYLLVKNGAFESGKDYSSWLPLSFIDLFSLQGKADGLYLIGLAGPEPGSGVPEPSTWALLVLGVFGLLYGRKRK